MSCGTPRDRGRGAAGLGGGAVAFAVVSVRGVPGCGRGGVLHAARPAAAPGDGTVTAVVSPARQLEHLRADVAKVLLWHTASARGSKRSFRLCMECGQPYPCRTRLALLGRKEADTAAGMTGERPDLR